MGAYFMGIDIGTFSSKGVITDENARVVASCTVEHGMENPQPGYFEHDAETVWWGDFCKLSQALLQQSGLAGKDIAAVGQSALGCDCLPVDENCRPLRKAILYGIDARAEAQAAALTDYYGGEKAVEEMLGRQFISGDVAPKIKWIRDNEPDVYAKTHKFLTGVSYLAAKLTGEYVVDRFLATASFRPLYNDKGEPDEAGCKPVCRPEQLPKALVATAIAGAVTRQAAEETGLAVGTPVITGSGDSAAEAVSCGVLAPGDLMLQFGSSLFIYYCASKRIRDNRVRGNYYVVPGTYSVAAGTNTAGTLTKWYRDSFFTDLVQAEAENGMNAYAAMAAGLADIPPGSMGLVTLPYFAGERTPINDPNAKGVLFGMTLQHNRWHMYRSALEGVGFSAAQHVDILAEHDLEIRNIMVAGGGTKNHQWMQIAADIIGQPLRCGKVDIGASYGDALMAAIGIGRYGGFADLQNVIELGGTWEPDAEKHKAYQKYREIYDELYLQTKGLMHRL